MGYFSKAFNKAVKSAFKPPKSTPRRVPGPRDNSGSLSFQEEGKPPARDEAGRVIVKVTAGDDADMEVYLYDEPKGTKWLAGRRKADDDFNERNVKVRVFFDGEDLQVVSPTGIVLGNVHRRDETAPAIVHQVSQFLANERELVGANFVFEFSGRVEVNWDEDEDEKGSTFWEPSVDLVLRTKLPVRVDIASQK